MVWYKRVWGLRTRIFDEDNHWTQLEYNKIPSRIKTRGSIQFFHPTDRILMFWKKTENIGAVFMSGFISFFLTNHPDSIIWTGGSGGFSYESKTTPGCNFLWNTLKMRSEVSVRYQKKVNRPEADIWINVWDKITKIESCEKELRLPLNRGPSRVQYPFRPDRTMQSYFLDLDPS